jgi:hypothetical protein
MAKPATITSTVAIMAACLSLKEYCSFEVSSFSHSLLVDGLVEILIIGWFVTRINP